ncbi:TMAO reductase system periplasmic protein TorT [Sulfitobacter aestuarii]|uniref:TMAO reductase system periplasmic protein TorT n=1 Tax=Sulfitobacter aestuarii TaxID=2161676 RepID=A0ABW5U3W6_9RHOB
MHYLAALIWLALSLPALAQNWALEMPRGSGDGDAVAEAIAYQPLGAAAERWHICVSYPHMKDAYWLSVNYGMVEEARRLGVSFRLVEAGGYPNLARQIEQVESCIASGADALIVGTVSFHGLSETIRRIAEQIPVIAAVNDIAEGGISARSAVSWEEMGAAAGRIIAKRHPAGGAPVRLAWFPGPEGAGWVRFVQNGFHKALRGSSAEVVVSKFGDTGREIQVQLVEEALDEFPDLDYIVGSAPTAEAAVSVLRARGLEEEIQIVSDYMSHAVYRGIRRGRILAAPTDFPILQGRLAIEMAVRAIEGKLEVTQAGPKIQIITRDNVDAISLSETLAPAAFVPVFETH